MKVSFVADVRTRFPSADFWLIRTHSRNQVGKPVKVYNPYYIGIKVIRTDIIIPDYLFHSLTHLHNKGVFDLLACGTTARVSIRVSDIKELSI